jgi:hypothetical protein
MVNYEKTRRIKSEIKECKIDWSKKKSRALSQLAKTSQNRLKVSNSPSHLKTLQLIKTSLTLSYMAKMIQVLILTELANVTRRNQVDLTATN